ncbi:MAG: hypothetical protein Q8920_01280 [Bacillota bacterium]|nr:hypothetical protein [Bacillota bacterium]
MNTFVQNFKRDKEEFHQRFETLNKKLDDINSRFDSFETGIGDLNKKLTDIEDIHYFLFSRIGGPEMRLDNVNVYLSSIQTSLKEYKTLVFEGNKEIDGEILMLKIKLQKIKPIISWENNKILFNKYIEIENDFKEIENILTTAEK